MQSMGVDINRLSMVMIARHASTSNVDRVGFERVRSRSECGICVGSGVRGSLRGSSSVVLSVCN